MYQFKGLTDKEHLIQTVIEQSGTDRGEAMFIIDHNLERCTEVWEGNHLLGYFLILARDGVFSIHGYKLCKGRTRLALRLALKFMDEEKRKLYSSHREANTQVNRLLKLMGFKDIGSTNGVKVLERV